MRLSRGMWGKYTYMGYRVIHIRRTLIFLTLLFRIQREYRKQTLNIRGGSKYIFSKFRHCILRMNSIAVYLVVAGNIWVYESDFRFSRKRHRFVNLCKMPRIFLQIIILPLILFSTIYNIMAIIQLVFEILAIEFIQ